MRQWFSNLLMDWTVYWNTRTIKEDLVYVNEKHNIYMHINPEEELLKVFVSGLLFKMPLNADHSTEEKVDEILKMAHDMNLENAYTEDLQEMLKYSEEDDDFEKCARIRDILKTRNNDKTNKSSSNL